MNILALLAGTLCVLSNGKQINCTATTEALIKLPAAAESRRLVWTSEDGKRLAVATVAANAGTLDLSKLRDVTLRVSGDAARVWPVDVHIGFGGGAVVTIPAKSVAKLTAISLPPARYSITFQAEHYLSAMRSFDLAANARADLGDVPLRPLPLLTGTVVTARDGKDVPLSGADVSFPASAMKPWIKDPHLATTDEKGAFRAELPENPAEAVVVSHTGVGSKTLRIERARDINLGVIRLLPGVKLTVKVVRPPALRTKPVTVTLFRRDPAVYEPTRIAARELAGSDAEAVFEEATAGDHIVVLQGAEPLARMSVPVKIEEGAPATAEAVIEPYTLAGRATFGGDPLDDAKVSIYPHGAPSWRVELATAADGTFGGTAWQHGVVGGNVVDARLGNVFFTDSPELGADPSVWNIDIKKRLITGRVYDAETNAPLPKADLFEISELLDEQGKKIQFRSSVRADDAGNYKVLAAKPGRYEIRFSRPDYVPKNLVFNIADEDGSKQGDIAAERGTAQAVVVRWPDGAPIASATIYDGDAPEPGSLPPTYHTDAAGTALIRGKKGEAHTLYVMPAEGSIAVVHMTIGGDDARPVEAVVGRPAGALRIIAVDSEGKPARGAVVLRYNGDVIPLEMVMRRYGPYAPAGERVLDRLPAGSYDVWLLAQRGALPLQPNARVGISSGEERVQIVVPKP
jgi:hypothetical protein